MRHNSVALTNMPVEFINVEPLNPLISSCEVKVLYHGKNRNKSYISKTIANEMAKSLPNIPIVGEYLEEAEDFNDHGQEMIINNKGVKFIRKTVPFGVVPADTKIWWQTFADDDGVQREYMMCEGYLWTGRYPETNRVLEKGNGQSMELDSNFMKGNWARLENDEDEYFIVDEAIFSALCILGEDVEPCFEGANIKSPSSIYSLDKDDFKIQMNDFLFELRDALNQKGGSDEMTVEENLIEDGQTAVVDNEPITNSIEEPIVEDNSVVEEPVVAEDHTTEEPQGEEPAEDTPVTEEPPVVEEPVTAQYNLEEIQEYQTLKSEYEALEVKYSELKSSQEAIQQELESLREVKTRVDRQEKTTLIDKFYMLPDEDLEQIKSEMDNYTLEEIESKLSIIAFRKQVNFSLETETQAEDIVAYNLSTEESVPAWVKAIDKVKQNKR